MAASSKMPAPGKKSSALLPFSEERAEAARVHPSIWLDSETRRDLEWTQGDVVLALCGYLGGDRYAAYSADVGSLSERELSSVVRLSKIDTAFVQGGFFEAAFSPTRLIEVRDEDAHMAGSYAVADSPFPITLVSRLLGPIPMSLTRKRSRESLKWDITEGIKHPYFVVLPKSPVELRSERTAKAVAISNVIALATLSLPEWDSEWLSPNRRMIDPAVEAREVLEDAIKIEDFRRKIPSENIGDFPEYKFAIDSLTDALENRIDRALKLFQCAQRVNNAAKQYSDSRRVQRFLNMVSTLDEKLEKTKRKPDADSFISSIDKLLTNFETISKNGETK